MTDSALLLDQQLCFALYSASRAMVSAYQPHLEKMGLTYPQYLVLLVLWEEDALSVSQIGHRLMLDSATLTPLLKRMEGRGLVQRTRSSADERVVQIFLTKEGTALRTEAEAIPQAMFCKTGLQAERLVALREDLKALTSQLIR